MHCLRPRCWLHKFEVTLFGNQVKADILAILLIGRSTSKFSKVFSMEHKCISECTNLTYTYITLISTLCSIQA